MSTHKIAVVIGSLRKDSINKKLAHALAKLAPAGFVFEEVNIGDLPLYNQDHEMSPGPAVERFKDVIRSSAGVIFVTPEYNRSIPGVLKNAIDHGSRPYGKSVWNGKPAGVIGISPGAIGSALAQQHLRNILVNQDMPMFGQPEAYIQYKDGFFEADGSVNAGSKGFLTGWVGRFTELVKLYAK